MFSFISQAYTEYVTIIYITLVLVIGYGLYFGSLKRGLLLAIFMFFFKNISIAFVSAFDVWKAASVMYAGVLLTRMKRQNNRRIPKKYIKFFLGLLMYSVLIYFVNLLIIEYSALTNYEGFFNREGRILTQLSYYLMVVLFFLFPFSVVQKSSDAIKIYSTLLNSVLLLSLLGLFQWFVYSISGQNIFPINRLTEFDYLSNKLYSELTGEISRVNSLAGEPKHLGMAIAFGLTILFSMMKEKYKFSQFLYLEILLFIFVLYFTFSTTGYFLSFLSLLVLVRDFRKAYISIILLTLSFILFFLVFGAFDNLDIFNKVVNKLGLEVQDLAVLNAVIANPTLMVLGFGIGEVHHYAVSYLPADFPLFKDSAFKPNSGFLFILCDFGLVGLMFISVLYFKVVAKLKKINESLPYGDEKKELGVVISASYIIYLIFIVRYNELFFLNFGLMLALLETYKTNARMLLQH